MDTITTVGTRGRVGEATPRIDGEPKVTGAFAYASDLHREGMLFGATLRSPVAYARINSVDTSRATATPAWWR